MDKSIERIILRVLEEAREKGCDHLTQTEMAVRAVCQSHPEMAASKRPGGGGSGKAIMTEPEQRNSAECGDPFPVRVIGAIFAGAGLLVLLFNFGCFLSLGWCVWRLIAGLMALVCGVFHDSLPTQN